ncbi:hypothetical protein QE393_003992 [Pseudomonas sp. SORGH_AS 211]|uniref:Uncharacterized protein n=1 Tax=Pseudomonas flavocrustae TaxID=2991719 RepID=A0ABT6IKQ7_9PSED|nr:MULTISPECIES: hypothetical protein [Pseudomonas]MDH4764878.1 hypothetical protein [Pseudomonas sp. CBMAI 2609]MDK8262989.1 hypothetical protein [Pseudomonas oryzihabitans]MDR6180732.1 hypothetical protein [Pseudomonas sp. SORGH_AS_0211]
MMWMLLVIVLFAAAAVVIGMLLSALIMGRALNQTHNLNGLDLDLTAVEPRMASLDTQDFANKTTARWTGAVVR